MTTTQTNVFPENVLMGNNKVHTRDHSYMYYIFDKKEGSNLKVFGSTIDTSQNKS